MTVRQMKGLIATQSGVVTPNEIGESTTQLNWAQNPGAGELALGNGRANAVYTAAIPTFGAIALRLGVINSAAGTNVILIIKWGGDDDAGSFLDESSLKAGAPAAGIVRWEVNANEYGPFAGGVSREFPIPAGWHHVKFALFSDGAPVANQRAQMVVNRVLGGGGSVPLSG